MTRSFSWESAGKSQASANPRKEANFPSVQRKPCRSGNLFLSSGRDLELPLGVLVTCQESSHGDMQARMGHGCVAFTHGRRRRGVGFLLLVPFWVGLEGPSFDGDRPVCLEMLLAFPKEGFRCQQMAAPGERGQTDGHPDVRGAPAFVSAHVSRGPCKRICSTTRKDPFTNKDLCEWVRVCLCVCV